jgi:very-short-patch-repair endonuclease
LTKSDLPQVCARCRKLKAAELGRFVKSSTRYAARYFICANCDANPPVIRLARFNNETPPERQVREALTGCGFQVYAEYKLENFIYDFAIPRLRLLIEIDSRKYHRFPRQKRKDSLKTQIAIKSHWKLVRLTPSDGLRISAVETVRDRRIELGLK